VFLTFAGIRHSDPVGTPEEEHKMKKIAALGSVVLLLAVVSMVGCGKQSGQNEGTAPTALETTPEAGRIADSEAGKGANVVKEYTCPMHADIVREKPGKCPTCGMLLQPKVPEGTKVEWVCPMPEDNVKQDKPGKCPKCGMFLRAEIVEESADSAASK